MDSADQQIASFFSSVDAKARPDFIPDATVRTHVSASLTDRPRKSHWTANALLIVMSGLILLGALEGIARLFPQYQVQTGDGEYRFCTSAQIRHEPNASFGYSELPGNSYFERYSPLDPWAYVAINSEGFRDNYSHGGQPVIVLGDSMTRGTLVNESQTYPSLLGHWHPTMDFRNYGTGGYGQANEIRVYEAKGQTPHKLAIVQFSLSTDIDDNVERATLSHNKAVINIQPAVGTPKARTKMLAKVHNFFWFHSKLYPWFYNAALRPLVANWDARRNMGKALHLTDALLVKLAGEAKANGAELVVLALPSWAEIAGRDDGMEPERQREMLRRFVAKTPGASLVDMAPLLSKEGPNKTYGMIDKHLTPYGHFIVAQALDRWMMHHWSQGPRSAPPARQFAPTPSIVPQCAKAPGYLRNVKMGKSEA